MHRVGWGYGRKVNVFNKNRILSSHKRRARIGRSFLKWLGLIGCCGTRRRLRLSRQAPENSSTASPADRLTAAVRDLVRETIAHPVENVPPPLAPTLSGVIWVSITVLNTLLLITRVPEALLKNTAFDFTSKLVGYVFGGILLVYSSWIRERLTALLRVSWFQALQCFLLAVLLVDEGIPLSSFRPTVVPIEARIFIDGSTVSQAPGKAIRVELGTHLIRIAPPDGAPTLPDSTPMIDYEFSIGWSELINRAMKINRCSGRRSTPWDLFRMSIS